MVKYEIEGEQQQQEDVVSLRLEMLNSGAVILVASKKGNPKICSAIVYLTTIGLLEKGVSINKELGFQTDGTGRIKDW